MVNKPDDFNTEEVIDVKFWSNKLFSFKTTRSPSYRFVPGQFSRVGLYFGDKIISHPYSIVSCDYDKYIEFLSIVVTTGELTSSLSKIKVGDKVLVDKRGIGYLTVSQFTTPINNLTLLSTGTGIAPFISIIRELDLFERVKGTVELIHSVREDDELVYADTIKSIEGVKYTPIVTRNPQSPYFGARIQERLLKQSDYYLTDNPDDKFMICGNPDMVKATRIVLESHNIPLNRRATPGRYAIENVF